jgi:capsular polysaccharide biosynthesis protein
MKKYYTLSLIKIFFKKIYKKTVEYFFFIIYGRVHLFYGHNKYFLKKKEIVINKVNYSVFKIINGRLYTDQVSNVAYINNNNILNGPSIQFKNNILSDISNNIAVKSGTTRFAKKIKGKVLSILTVGGGNNNYWHWVFDVLPRIFLYEKFYSLKNLDKILVPNLKEKFQIETLSDLGIKNKIIINANYYRHIKAKELYATSHPNISNLERVPYWIIVSLRDRFIKMKNQTNKFDKIYIDRADSKSNVKSFRKIINEKEIINFLISKGFKIIKLSEFSFLEQVSIFNNAKYIIGLHGAGFANLVFCKKNTNILEIKPKKAGNIIKNLSVDSNLRYSSIDLNPLDNPIGRQFGSLYLPLKTLKLFLK